MRAATPEAASGPALPRWPGLDGRSRLGARELLVAAALLTGVGALVFYPHIRGGGFYSDDWASAATYHFAGPPRFIHALQAYAHTFGSRPLLSVAKAAGYALLGLHGAWHLTLAVVLGVLVSWVFYAVLRRFRLAPLPALLVAALALVFPWSDSTRLWATASLNQLATLFYLLGLWVALIGLERRGRPAVAAHGAALVLYAGALLVYESVGGLVLVSGLLYWLRGPGSWGRIWKRWLADVCIAAAVLGWSASVATAARPAPSAHQVLHDLPHFIHQALSLAVHALVPGLPLLVPAVVLGLVGGMAAVRAARGRLAMDGDLLHWLAVTGAAVILSAVSFAPLVGSGLHPLDQGLGNRGNLAVALPLCLFVYGLVAVAARALLPNRYRRGASWLAVGVVLGIGFGYGHLTRGDIGRWDRAAQLQHRVLSALRSTAPRPLSGDVVYAYGAPALVSPGVSVFSEFWDLSNAFRLQAGRSDVGAYPIVQGVRFVCTPRAMYPVASPGPYDALQRGFGPAEGAYYGQAILVDVRRARATVVTGPRSCLAATARLSLAPLVG